MRRSLDIHTRIPEDMATYLENNGFHFSRKAYHYAIRDISGVEPMTRDEADEIFRKHDAELERNTMYDAAYKLTKEKAIHYGKSLPNEKALAMHVKEDLEADETGEEPFREWVADRIGEGRPIDWYSIL